LPSSSTIARAGLTLEHATAERNAWLELDLDALTHNVQTLRASLGLAVELIAVVKANAYGHGVAGVAPALEAAGVDRFAVVWISEAVALRSLGITKPILVLGHSFRGDAAAAVFHNITLTVHSRALGEVLNREALNGNDPIRDALIRDAPRRSQVHIKVDSGLHRFGLAIDEAVALAEYLRELPGIEVEGLTTHMANADDSDDSFAEIQHAAFAEAVRRLPWIPYRHTANSATALRRPQLRYQGVRVGLALHGILPPNTAAPPAGLRPVMSLKARLARVSDVPAGEGVSYGLTWRAREASQVGLVPVGYADGWRRAIGARGSVLIRGLRCPIVGRVAMDQFMVDVTHVPAVAEGEEAVLLGSQGSDRITADEVAAWEDTISWEVLAGMQARLPRIFHHGGIVEHIDE
jgi:alanine racemase